MNTSDLQESLPERLQDVEFEDRLEVVGIVAGTFLVLVGLTTIVGAPWAHKATVAAAAIQVLGALATIAVGAGLVWLTQTQR